MRYGNKERERAQNFWKPYSHIISRLSAIYERKSKNLNFDSADKSVLGQIQKLIRPQPQKVQDYQFSLENIALNLFRLSYIILNRWCKEALMFNPKH